MERLTLEEAICRVRGVVKKQRWNSKYTKVLNLISMSWIHVRPISANWKHIAGKKIKTILRKMDMTIW